MLQTAVSRRQFLKTSLAVTSSFFGISVLYPVLRVQNTIIPMNAIPVTGPEELASRADLTFQKLLERFVSRQGNSFHEHDPLRPGDRPDATLWPYTGAVSALNALAKLPGKKDAVEPALRSALDGLDAYQDRSSLPAGYDSYPVSSGGGQKYYDDNAWVGLELIRAYNQLGDPAYREKAAETFQFVISGWSDALGGGIYWRERDMSTKNTCSNGPAALLALKLFQATGQPYYLDWAQRLLDWLKRLISPADGVYWDNIKSNGTIDRCTYTYNTGTVLHANVLLHKMTGLIDPLDEARRLAQASLDYFASRRDASDVRLFPQTPWFNAVLARGYAALAGVDPQSGQACLTVLQGYLDYAWQTARGQDELLSPDASGKDRDDPHRWLLDQAGWVEMYALAASHEA